MSGGDNIDGEPSGFDRDVQDVKELQEFGLRVSQANAVARENNGPLGTISASITIETSGGTVAGGGGVNATSDSCSI